MAALLRYAFTPDASLNYGFIAAIYAGLGAVSLALFVAQYWFEVHVLTGFWIVSFPCLPACLYVLILRHLASSAPVDKTD
jgi:hypothetical protein